MLRTAEQAAGRTPVGGRGPEVGQWEALPRQGEDHIGSKVLGQQLRLSEWRSGGDFRELQFREPSTGENLQTHMRQHQGQNA